MSCDLCNGAGMVIGEHGARPCVCVRDARWKTAGIPARYHHKSFADYDASLSRSAGDALVMCRAFVRDWPTMRHQGLLLTGPVGVGKTHLTCVTLMECSRQWGASIAFVDVGELFSRIKASFTAGWAVNEAEILAPILKADILAIDDLDAVRSTEWGMDKLALLLDTRYREDKSVLLTTNSANQPAGWVGSGRAQLVANTLSDRASPLAAPTMMRRDTLGDRIGQRMYSRVQEMCRIIEVDGEDQRAAAGRRRS